MKKINYLKLITTIIICELAGGLGVLLGGSTSDVYNTLIKPPLSPPSIVFGIVWPILYLLMGIALYIIVESPKTKERTKAIYLFIIQLIVNIIWPIVFFRFEMFTFAVIVILLLDILVFLTTYKFYKINKISAYLMIPYLLWILFASYLNIAISILN